MAKTGRILCIYDRLLAGKAVVKREEAARFGVDTRTIQRDLDDIRAYLADVSHAQCELVYDRRRPGYVIRTQKE